MGLFRNRCNSHVLKSLGVAVVAAAHLEPTDGTLDLHTFDPRDLPELIPAFLEECRDRGILQVRIIHGKGKGVLRRRVQAILGRLPMVVSWGPGGSGGGQWGATIVILNPAGSEPATPDQGSPPGFPRR